MNYKKKYLKYKNKYLNLVLYGGMELVTPKYTIAAMTNTILSSDSHDILPIIDTYKEIKVHPVISLPTDVEIQNQEYLLYIQQYDFDNINNICENFYNVYNKYSTVVTFRRYIYYCKTIKIKENKNKNHKNNFDVYLSDHIPVVYYKDQTMYFTFNVQIDNFDKFDHNKSWLYDTLEKKIFYYYIKALNICKLIYNKEKEYDTITNIIITLQECMYPLYIIISKILSIIFKSINHSFVFQNIEKNEYEYSGNYKTYKFTRLYKNIEIVDEYGFTINNTYYTDVDGGFANFTTYKNCTVSKPMLIYDKNVNAFTNDNSHKNQQTSSDISPTNKILKGSLYRSCRSCIFTINNEHQKITVINVHLTKTFGLDDLHIIINNKSSEYFKNYHNSTNSILRTYYDTYFDTTYDEYFDTDSILVVMGDFNMLFTIENKNPIILSKFIYNELYNLTYADSTVDWILYFDPINKSNEKLEGINNEDLLDLHEVQSDLHEYQPDLHEYQPDLHEDQQELDENQQELDEDQQELDEDQQELDEDQQELEQIDINKYIDEDQQELDEDQPDLHKDQSDLPEDINDIESLSTILHEDLDEEILEIQNKYNKILEIQNEITKYNNLNKILELNLANDTLKLPVIKSQLKKITANIHLYESYLQISSNRATPQVTLDITALRNNNLNYITKRDKLTTNIANNTKRLETNMATIIELKQRLDTLKTELDIQKTELAKKIIHNDTYKLEIELYELEAKLKDTNNNILSIESRKQHIENVIKSQNTNLETHQKNYDEELKKYNLSSKFKIDPELLKDLEEADYKTHLESGHVIHILRYIITKRQIVTNNKEYQLILNKLLLLGNTSRNKRDLEIINSEIKLVTNLIKNLKNQITEIDTKIEELKNISEELKEQIVNLKTTK